MKLVNFIIWLSAGAVIGWFASRMVTLERGASYKHMTTRIESPENE